MLNLLFHYYVFMCALLGTAISEMSYYVLSGTLNFYSLIYLNCELKCFQPFPKHGRVSRKMRFCRWIFQLSGV